MPCERSVRGDCGDDDEARRYRKCFACGVKEKTWYGPEEGARSAETTNHSRVCQMREYLVRIVDFAGDDSGQRDYFLRCLAHWKAGELGA